MSNKNQNTWKDGIGGNSAEIERLFGNPENSEIDVVTGLVQTLLSSVSKNKESRERVGGMANKILEVEAERTRLLREYVGENGINEQENISPEEDEHTTNNETAASNNNIIRTTTNTDESLIQADEEEETENKLYQENLALKVELQRLQEYDSKATQLINQYETAITHLRDDAKTCSSEYEVAKQKLIASYKERLDEEQRTHDEYKIGHDRLWFALQSLKDTLKDTNQQMGDSLSI